MTEYTGVVMHKLIDDNNLQSENFHDAILSASKRIAPAWPLDSSIAVNPWWPLREEKFENVAVNLETLGQAKCLMPKSYYLSEWGHLIKEEHLMLAAKEQNFLGSNEELIHYLEKENKAIPHWHNISDLLDALPMRAKKMPWRDEIIQQISQFCGLYFQHSEYIQNNNKPTDSLYKAWLAIARQDKGIEILMGEPGLHQYFVNLPECPKLLCDDIISALGSSDSFEDYAHALLFDVHGWASYLAYQRWQDNFTNTPNYLVEQLLSIRLAWDWVLWCHTKQQKPLAFDQLQTRFIKQFEDLPFYKQQQYEQQKLLWIWQKALEISYQSQIHKKLSHQLHSVKWQETKSSPLLQAVFCIDVRSEPIRRALEAQHPDIETIGFAGFFGLPIEYALNDSEYRRSQLPGLLMPVIQAIQNKRDHATQLKSRRLQLGHQQSDIFNAAPASLGLVEMFGFLKVGELVKNSFWPSRSKQSINELCDNQPFSLTCKGRELNMEEKTDLAESVLINLGLCKNFAPTVLLLGHGSSTANNPQAASLDCGACGGQTGEVNAKVLAQLLNDTNVRAALYQRKIKIPTTTSFVAGLHNTTSDEIICFGEQKNQKWQSWVSKASKLAQSNRAASLAMSSDKKLAKQYQHRCNDWSEIRVEWGLANNAAFIVAPRILTRQIDLEGRSFLHDYDWQNDQNFSTLELIMTAPMIVTNWINLQYYASVTDNRIYGSGNKLLHNVVGGNIGIFEGNGGDLRIGLSKQSVHDGEKWRHTPLRLNVYIAAPREAIENIINKHETLSQLINNEWLYIFQLDAESKAIKKYFQSSWQSL